MTAAYEAVQRAAEAEQAARARSVERRRAEVESRALYASQFEEAVRADTLDATFERERLQRYATGLRETANGLRLEADRAQAQVEVHKRKTGPGE